LGSASASDLLVRIALVTGLVAMALAAAIALQVLRLRRDRLRRQARAERFLAAWRPRVYDAALGAVPADLPPLSAEDDQTFLLLWNQVQDGLRGPPRAGLNALARRVGARTIALRRLGARGPAARLVALRTLGHFGEAEDFETVRVFLGERSPVMCLAAARALAHIDPVRAVEVVWPRLVARQDWPVAQVATMLREADGALVGDALLRSLPALAPADRRRLLPLVALLDEVRAGQAVASLLSTAEDQDSLAVALQHLRAPALLPEVVRLAAHPAWPVRTQAASALGRLGGPAERPCLVGLLSDPEWWVRYRAAQALRAGRFGGAAGLAALAPGLTDRFARDMVAHVLAEGAP